MSEPNDIRELLIAAQAAEPYASNSNTAVYELSGMPDYLLRTPKLSHSEFKAKLEETTALTPVHLCAMNVGQPVFLGEGFSIIKKVTGNPLWSYYAKYDKGGAKRRSAINGDGHKAVLDRLLALPDVAWQDLLQGIRYLNERGIEADIHWGNVLLDERTHRLHLIDTCCSAKFDDALIAKVDIATAHSLRKICEKLCDVSLEPPSRDSSEIMALARNINKKLKAAALAVDYPTTQDALIGEIPPRPSRLQDISAQVEPLSMRAQRKSFVAALRQVEAYSHAQER